MPFIRSLSRAGYRPLLEAGVRVFEWNGSMLHAKTAVADSRWARVGSTNLNLTSWFGKWELDVAVEDEPFANAMEAMYLEDLSHATEVVLTARRRVRLSQQPEPRRHRPLGVMHGGRARAAAGALLLAVSGVAMAWPKVVAIPLSLMLGWVALSLLFRAATLQVQKNDGRVPCRRDDPSGGRGDPS